MMRVISKDYATTWLILSLTVITYFVLAPVKPRMPMPHELYVAEGIPVLREGYRGSFPFTVNDVVITCSFLQSTPQAAALFSATRYFR